MAPFPKTLSLKLPLSTSSDQILAAISSRLQLSPESASLLRLYARSGRRIDGPTTLRDLSSSPNAFLDLEIRLSILGGKGGFGSMLRAQGGKMSARKGEENNDSCRDLNGRRLKTVKEAQSLAAYLAAAPAREAALSKAQAEKYAKLEKMLGRKPKDAKDFEEAAGRLDDAGGDLGQGSGDDDEDAGAGPSNLVPVRGKEASSSGVSGGAGGKRGKLEDSKFLEESREAVDKAKSAVALAMAKRKKKEAAAKGVKATATSSSSSSSPVSVNKAATSATAG